VEIKQGDRCDHCGGILISIFRLYSERYQPDINMPAIWRWCGRICQMLC